MIVKSPKHEDHERLLMPTLNWNLVVDFDGVRKTLELREKLLKHRGKTVRKPL